LTAADPRDVSLIDVDIDLEAIEVGHRHHSAASETAADRWRNDLANLGFLAEHRSREWGTNLRVLEADAREPNRRFGGGHTCGCRSSACARGGCARLGGIDLLLRHQLDILGADVAQAPYVALLLIAIRLDLELLCTRAGEIRCGLGNLRLVVAVLKPRDDLAALNERPFGHPKVG
jgi:hypothetical protein